MDSKKEQINGIFFVILIVMFIAILGMNLYTSVISDLSYGGYSDYKYTFTLFISKFILSFYILSFAMIFFFKNKILSTILTVISIALFILFTIAVYGDDTFDISETDTACHIAQKELGKNSWGVKYDFLENCMTERAIKNHDFSYCDNLEGITDKYAQQRCYSKAVSSPKDAEICENLDSLQNKMECYVNIANSTKDSSWCAYTEEWTNNNYFSEKCSEAIS